MANTSTTSTGAAAAIMRITGTKSLSAAITQIAAGLAAQKKLTAMREQRAKRLTKKWEDYSYTELAHIHDNDPTLYAALKADRDRRTAR